jgi:precorrin-6x reductase
VILVLGGTADGREAAERLAAAGRRVIYSSVSAYNAPAESVRLDWHIGAMDAKGLAAMMHGQRVDLLVDGTHPYARAASENALAVCRALGVRYIRLERPGLEAMAEKDAVIRCESYEAAVAYLAAHPGNILTTTGSRELSRYQALPRERVFPRVLPTAEVIAKCEELGYLPRQIVAMQGPFSFELNAAMIHALKIRYITTKDSGDIGGVAEKIRAAAACGAEVLCIDRPKLDYPETVATAEALVAQLMPQKGGQS